jgi:hypothetical protein
LGNEVEREKEKVKETVRHSSIIGQETLGLSLRFFLAGGLV